MMTKKVSGEPRHILLNGDHGGALQVLKKQSLGLLLYDELMCQEVATFPPTPTTELRAASRPPHRRLNLSTTKEI
jgi:hypothetical protein